MNEETRLNFMRQDWPSKRPKVVNNVMPGLHYPDPVEPFLAAGYPDRAEWLATAHGNRAEGQEQYRANVARNYESQVQSRARRAPAKSAA